MSNEAKAFASRISELYIEHEEVIRVWDRLDSMRVHRRSGKTDDPRHLFLTGLSGVGKTQVGKRYREKNKGYTIVDHEETEIDIEPVLYVKLPFPFTELSFYKKIVKELGGPDLRSDSRINFVKEQMLKLLDAQKTEMIIFDEMNFIDRSPRFDNRVAMEMLKDLANEGKVCLVCMGTPKILPLRDMEDEYQRRFQKEQINKFDSCDIQFCELLKKIEEKIVPPYELELGNDESGWPQILFQYSQGRIGYLHYILLEAFRLLGVFEDNFYDIKKADLTVDIVRRAKFNFFGE